MPTTLPPSRRSAVRAALIAPALLAALLTCNAALAQSSGSGAKKNDPPVAPIASITRSGDSSIMTMLFVGVLAIAVVAITFLPSKRGHQD